MCFEAARSLPDGSWDSKHEAGRLPGLHRREERGRARRGTPGCYPESLLGSRMPGRVGPLGVKTGPHFPKGTREADFLRCPPPPLATLSHFFLYW